MPITTGLLKILQEPRKAKPMPVNSTAMFLKRLKAGQLKTPYPQNVLVPTTEAKDPEVQIFSPNSSSESTGLFQDSPTAIADVPPISGGETVTHFKCRFKLNGRPRSVESGC